MSTELIALVTLLVVQGFIFAKMVYDSRQSDKTIVRARTWELEDRQALAETIARKVEVTTNANASQLASVAADVAAAGRLQAQTNAENVAAEQRRLALQVAEAEASRKRAEIAAVESRQQVAETLGAAAVSLAENTAQTTAVAAGLKENTALTLDVGKRIDGRIDAVEKLVHENLTRLGTLAREHASDLAAEAVARFASSSRITRHLDEEPPIPEPPK